MLKEDNGQKNSFFKMISIYSHTNFSRFWRLNKPYRILTRMPMARNILFLMINPAQITSLKLSGILNGFRKMFHWVLSSVSDNIIRATPNKTITTAVPLPFLMMVENINDRAPKNTTGYISWYDISKNIDFI